jgi:hypothetical protein
MTQWNKYERTAARRHGKPGREARPPSITIDIHSHVAVPAAAAFVKPHFDPMTNPLVLHATPETRALNQKQEEDIRECIIKHDRRLTELDAMGVDFQLVMPPPQQCYYTVPVAIAVEAACIVNDGIADFVGKEALIALPASAACRCWTATRPRRSSSAASASSGSKARRSSPTSPAASCPIRPSSRSGKRPRSSTRSSCCIR